MEQQLNDIRSKQEADIEMADIIEKEAAELTKGLDSHHSEN